MNSLNSLPLKQRMDLPRIGLYGGSFNPIHNAHVALINAVQSEWPCDRMIIMPTNAPPHKPPFEVSQQHRLAMISLALQNTPNILVSEEEIKRPGPHYTYDTVCSLKSQYPDTQIMLVLGADSFIDLSKWYRWQELLPLVTVLVGIRTEGVSSPQLQQAESIMRAHAYQYYLLNHPLPQVSSSQIRALLKHPTPSTQAALSHLVPPAVASYLKKENLYAKPTNHV